MLKNFGLEDSKPIKTPMSSEIKLTRNEDGESVDNTKYRGVIGVETLVYVDSDHAGDYVNRKITSGTFMGCCLTSWFSKKQTTLVISTTEVEYVSTRKSCQQALLMKPALVDYDIKLDDIPVLCDNKGAIDLMFTQCFNIVALEVSKGANSLQAEEQDIPPPTITAMKIPIIRKGEYDIWSMRMRQYICHTDHNLWDVIVNGDLEEEPAPTTGETSAPPAPKTAKQLAARRNQERVKSILLLAIPDEYLLKFHNVADAKSLWEAIKSRFGGNVESKKMQKNVLKHQFENFSTASNESLDKAYDRFQKLISQLEVHGAPISKEDINQKFLRSLPSSWNQIALIMRNKPDIDETDIDDLYNNLRVYEDELKSGDFGMDGDDLEELDLRWQVAMLTIKVKKSRRNQGRRSYGDNGRSNAPTIESSSQALVAQDGLGSYDWSNDFELEPVNYALMAISSSSSSSSSDSETSDDEEEVYGVQKVGPENQAVKTRDDKSGQNSHKQGVGFRKVKAYFVCRSTEHLIKDCNFHDKKSQESNLKNVVNTGKWESKPVWDNTKRVNHPNFSKYPHLSETFFPTCVSTRTGLHRPSINTARSVCTARPSINTARPISIVRPSISTVRPSISIVIPVCTARPSISTARHVCTARPSISTARPIYASRSIYLRMDNVRLRGSCSHINRSYYTKPAFRPKDLKQDVKTFGVKNMTTAGKRAVVNTGKGKLDTDLKKSRWVWRPKGNYLDHVSKDSGSFMLKKGNPEILLQDHAVVDSGCSSHMTGNKAYLSDYEDFNGGFVAFGSDPKGDELKFNLFSVSQMCDKKNSVLFTESECLILSPSFKLLDESQVVLRAPRKDDVYSFYSLDLKNIVPSDYNCTQDSYVAGSSGKDKGPTKEYILLPLQPHRTRIPVKDVVQDAQEKPFENALLRQGWPRFIGCC
ncbi:hypothetical protein Tco_0941854 [Tanacetum coccineum]|uniref:Uncharacterized protein n=1 Tax=Tanacetum coccineum TaxID=301880 RepID=A0ABQ5DT03_9ASTR